MRFAPPLLGALLFASGCDGSCLGDGVDCKVTAPCQKLTFTCDDPSLELRLLGPADSSPGGPAALASRSDVVLGNSRAVAVLAGIGNQNYLDPGGGALLDLGSRGRDDDDLRQILHVVGVLPRDAVRYESMRLLDERPRRVAVQLRGTLDGQPSMVVHTLYEARPCDPGLRVRTEIVNGGPDPLLWALGDGLYWSSRGPLPFTPTAGSGFAHPAFDLLTINDAFRLAPYVAASSHHSTGSGVSYACIPCNEKLLEGFQSPTVSTAGLPRRVVPPREYLVYERFYAVAGRPDVAGAGDVALEVRRQLHGERFVTLAGRVERGVSSERQASLLVVEGSDATTAGRRIPWSQIVPDGDGRFSLRVPAGRSYLIETHAFGRLVATQELGAVTADRDLGSLPLTAPGRVTVRIVDATTQKPIDGEIFVVPVDAAARDASVGSLHGQHGLCAPWLGSPVGASPACNRFLFWKGSPGPTTVEVPPGRYHLYAFHGPFFTLDRKTIELGVEERKLDFAVRPLGLLPKGALSADLHVHGAASFDSSLPDLDRVLSFAAADVDVVIATDHDVAWDYADKVKQLGLEARLTTVVGVETTGHIPWLYAPGYDFPLVIGHYNFWPIKFDPTMPRNGAPFDELIEPGELFDRVAALYTGLPLIQLNHPWGEAEFGRDLGFPRAIGLDLLANLPATDDGTPGGLYVRQPADRHRNDDHHAQEVMNGTQNDLLLQYRAFWFYTLNQGRLRTGTANSDSHGLTDNTIGSPRNVIFAGTSAGPGFSVDKLNQAIRDGALLGTNGPLITATVIQGGKEEQPFGLKPFRPTDGARLKLEVAAAPWIPVDEIRIVVNGRVVKTITGLPRPGDPFAATPLSRFVGELPLAPLLPPSGDAWLVVEAGAPLLLAGDLGGGPTSAQFPDGRPDGMIDTTDNNGDGKVDRADVAPGKKIGPLRNPAPPAGDSDPRFHFAQVVTDGYPMAFTNPFVLDRDGNGRFDGPGVQGSR